MINTTLEKVITEDEFLEAMHDSAKHYLEQYHHIIEVVKDVESLQEFGYRIKFMYNEENNLYTYKKYKPEKIGLIK